MKTTQDIWQEYHNKLSGFIKARVSRDIAEDILQDVFLKIHIRIGSLKEDARLESWLYQITRNSIIDYYREKKPTDELPIWFEQEQGREDEIIRQELSSCLTPMIEELPEKYRNAIKLSEIEKKPQKEVAELENISLSGAKSRVQRGRGLLKAMLNNCCQIEINKNNQLVSYEKKGLDDKFC